MNEIAASVVIPTRNRPQLLGLCLRALARQKFSRARAEIVVANDGGSDVTREVVRAADLPFPVTVVESQGAGPAAARNAGARHARGELLVFLDDDMLPARGFLDAHWRCHLRQPGGVVVGPVKSIVRGRIRSELQQQLIIRRNMRARALELPDLLTGNCSMRRELFDMMGHFNGTLKRREDYDFSVRLIAAGIPFVFCAEARAIELYSRGADLFLDNAYHMGRSEAQILKANPDAASRFGLDRFFKGSGAARALRLLVWRTAQLPRIGELFRNGLQSPAWAPIGLRFPSIARALAASNYWSGVAEEFESQAALKRAVSPPADDKVGAGVAPKRVASR